MTSVRGWVQGRWKLQQVEHTVKIGNLPGIAEVVICAAAEVVRGGVEHGQSESPGFAAEAGLPGGAGIFIHEASSGRD
jgi:hypothetical protein